MRIKAGKLRRLYNRWYFKNRQKREMKLKMMALALNEKLEGDRYRFWERAFEAGKKNKMKILEKYEDYVQLLVPTGPPSGVYQSPDQAMDAAKVFNDGLADIV